ncbi:MAG TPA: NUDIX hydrolase [Holophagaceae bacterium]|jgi:phosphatase NudJ|nr:NUDIX hydrolase [Holophagaceae bacterium]
MPCSLTVAAVIERRGRFLFVEERDGNGPRVLNQPAGHVEEGEALIDAAIREVREETGLAFAPEGLVGIYALRAANGKDYLRLCFHGSVEDGEAQPQDADILACHWLTREELASKALRSGLVARCLDDYLKGQRLPLEAASVFMQER